MIPSPIESIMPFETHDRVLDWIPTGSRWMCKPPVENTDDDRAVLVEDMAWVVDRLQDDGWELAGSIHEETRFCSLTKGDVNLILMDSEGWFEKWQVATEACTVANLHSKAARIKVFKAILYNK